MPQQIRLVDLAPPEPTLSEQVLLLSIQQSEAAWEGRLEEAKELGEKMLGLLRYELVDLP